MVPRGDRVCKPFLPLQDRERQLLPKGYAVDISRARYEVAGPLFPTRSTRPSLTSCSRSYLSVRSLTSEKICRRSVIRQLPDCRILFKIADCRIFARIDMSPWDSFLNTELGIG